MFSDVLLGLSWQIFGHVEKSVDYYVLNKSGFPCFGKKKNHD